jgi:glycosyltransferase involved in cell wall biosynthesis
MTRLSIIIITKNEAERLPRCLESVRFADEIIVLDSGSTDATLEIARRYTDKVFVSDGWPGFGPQKNAALSHATGDWVLSLDADEWLTPELAAEILAVVAADHSAAHSASKLVTQAEVYEIPRLSSFCGREMRHSGWWPDRVARLFRRGAAQFSDDLVHERLVFSGVAHRLTNHFNHDSVRNLDDVLRKVNTYSTAGAVQAALRGKKGGMRTAITHAAWAFFRTYFMNAGVLDGREGFILAVANAEGVYYKYIKIMYMRESGDA